MTAAAAIGAGGLIMGGPAAALMAAPAAQAAPVIPAPQQNLETSSQASGFFGGRVWAATSAFQPVFGIRPTRFLDVPG